MLLYLTGSLRNPQIPSVARQLREAGHQVFDDWFSAGPDADRCWQEYETARGRTYPEALAGLAAEHIFDFDYKNLLAADAVVLVAPAGKSSHLELGYVLGWGKPGHILLEPETERFDVMYRFATGVHLTIDSLLEAFHVRPASDQPLRVLQTSRSTQGHPDFS